MQILPFSWNVFWSPTDRAVPLGIHTPAAPSATTKDMNLDPRHSHDLVRKIGWLQFPGRVSFPQRQIISEARWIIRWRPQSALSSFGFFIPYLSRAERMRSEGSSLCEVILARKQVSGTKVRECRTLSPPLHWRGLHQSANPFPNWFPQLFPKMKYDSWTGDPAEKH